MFFKIFVLCFTLKLVSFSVSELVRNEDDCYALSQPEYKQFATKTAYAMIKGQLAEADYKVEGWVFAIAIESYKSYNRFSTMV